MEIITDAAIYWNPNKIEEFAIRVDETKKDLVIERLKYERKEIVDHFRSLKELGEIKSIFRPKNKKKQKELDNLIRIKKKLTKSIEKLQIIFK